MKYYKAEDVLAIFSEEERPLNWTDSEAEIQAENDFDCYKGMIESLPTIEVSEDCISREYLKSLGYINKGDFNSVETIREWIDNAPSVVPTTERSSKVGEWIKYYEYCEELDRELWYGYTCSLCGRWEGNAEPYCNCGAKMKGVE